MAAARQSRPALLYRRLWVFCSSAHASLAAPDEKQLPPAAARHLLAGFGSISIIVLGKNAAPPVQGVGRLVFVKIDDKDIAGGAAGENAHIGSAGILALRGIPAIECRLRDQFLPEAISSQPAPGASSSGVRMAGMTGQPANPQHDTSRPSRLARPNQARKIQLPPPALYSCGKLH
jgi:hypothetical protein